MGIFPFIVVAWILVVGLYGIVTSRHLVHQIVCLIVVQSSTYVLLLGGRLQTRRRPPPTSPTSRCTRPRSTPWCRPWP